MTAIAPGTRFGPYEIAGWVGAGGMGEVYRAYDPRLDRSVAIKVIASAMANPDRVRRFEREARAAAQISHPAILAVYDVATHGGIPYIVSELLEGEALRTRLRGGPLPLARRLRLRARPPTDWPRRTIAASFTATSSPRLCSSPPTAVSRFSTSVLPS